MSGCGFLLGLNFAPVEPELVSLSAAERVDLLKEVLEGRE
jgi:hypothetical protein